MNVLNEIFEIDMASLYNEFISAKNRDKRKLLEKMNQLKKHILFFDFLENYYVPKDEVSKNHVNVIKKSNLLKKIKPLLGLVIHLLRQF